MLPHVAVDNHIPEILYKLKRRNDHSLTRSLKSRKNEPFNKVRGG